MNEHSYSCRHLPETFKPMMIFTKNMTISKPTQMGVLLAIMILPLNGCKKKVAETLNVAVTVQVEHPFVAPISEGIRADAVLAPLAEAALSPRISAPIQAEYVRLGSRVHRNEVLLTLEARDLEGSALDSKGNLTAAEASFATATQAVIPEAVQNAKLQVSETQANLNVALQTAEDRKRLFAEGALPGRDADLAAAAAVQAQAAYAAAYKHLASILKTTQKADVKAAEGQLTSAEGRFINAEAQVGYATIRSPIDGVVTSRPLFPGETAPAGSPVITVMDTSSLLAKLHIVQANAQQLKLGDKAKVTIPGIDDPLEATVSLISPALDPGSTTVEVWLKLANPNGSLKVGTAVHVAIQGHTTAVALQVPISALLPAQDGSSDVMVVDADGTAHLRTVKTGMRSARMVQIISGLSPNDTVITDGSYGLDDGTKVIPSAVGPRTEDEN
jgi:HlyD family secretion protein